MREELIQKVSEELVNEGFEECVCLNTRSSFDIAARRGNILLLKILENIDAFTHGQANDMKKIASLLLGYAFLVGERSKGYELENEVLYERYGVSAANFDTFKKIVNGEYPKLKKFNSMLGFLNGKKLREARLVKNLSAEELAGLSGISVETIYRYENELIMTSLENVDKLESILQTVLRKRIDPFQEVNKVRTIKFFGLESVRTRYPFNILAREKSGKERVVVGEDVDKRTIIKRAKLYEKVSDIFKSYSCFIVGNREKKIATEVPVISREELSDIRNSSEFIKLVKEKSN